MGSPRTSEVLLEQGQAHGFVEFEDQADVEPAIKNMHQSELFGKTISASRARGTTLDKKKALWEKEADAWVEDVEQERSNKRQADKDKEAQLRSEGMGQVSARAAKKCVTKLILCCRLRKCFPGQWCFSS